MADWMRFIASLPLSAIIRKSTWLIPLLQTLHILATSVVLGAVIMIDLRVWGVSSAETAAARTRRFLPWIWVALVVLTVTGIGLMLGAPRTVADPVFWTKMVMMLPAIAATALIAVALRFADQARKQEAGAGHTASVMATLTLVLWVGVTFAGRGRWIPSYLTMR